MFPPISNSYSNPSTYQQSSVGNDWDGVPNQIAKQISPRLVNPDSFTMNATPYHQYYLNEYTAPINQYQFDLDEYYINNKDKLLAKWNQRYTNSQPPLGGMDKFSQPQLPRLKLPAVDWENFKRDAELALKKKKGFLRNLDNKVQIMDNLLMQKDDWLVERYYDQKQRFKKAGITKINYKLQQSLKDYEKFSNKYYGNRKDLTN